MPSVSYVRDWLHHIFLLNNFSKLQVFFCEWKEYCPSAWTRQWQIWQAEFRTGVSEVFVRRFSLPLDFTSCHCQPQFYQKWENPFYMRTYPEPLCTDSQQRGRRVLLKAIIQSRMKDYECNRCINQLQWWNADTHPCTSLCLKVKLWDPYHVLSLIQLYMKAPFFQINWYIMILFI